MTYGEFQFQRNELQDCHIIPIPFACCQNGDANSIMFSNKPLYLKLYTFLLNETLLTDKIDEAYSFEKAQIMFLVKQISNETLMSNYDVVLIVTLTTKFGNIHHILEIKKILGRSTV